MCSLRRAPSGKPLQAARQCAGLPKATRSFNMEGVNPDETRAVETGRRQAAAFRRSHSSPSSLPRRQARTDGVLPFCTGVFRSIAHIRNRRSSDELSLVGLREAGWPPLIR